jgi:hypothetical protein
MIRGVFRTRRALSFCAALALALSVAPAVTSRRTLACPVEPLFSGEVESADVIVVGKVTSGEQVAVKVENEDHDLWVANFEAAEVLKGQYDTTKPLRLAGYHLNQMEAKAADERTLLVMAAGVNEYSLRYTIAVVDVTDLDVRTEITPLVREMVEVARLAEGDERKLRQIEWGVRCVESTRLREEGIRELSRNAVDYDEEGEVTLFFDAMQRERLVRVLLGIDDPDADGAIALAGLLCLAEESRALAQLEHWLEATADTPPERASWMMHVVAQNLEWATGSWLASRYPDDADRGVRRAAILRFLDLMRTRQELPEALADLEMPEASDEDSEAAAERRQLVEEVEAEFEFTPEEEEESGEEPVEEVELNSTEDPSNQ